ncbi:hypothetical protein M427DRAFT_53039 [Gonapodya prolifera JEL478]|uniref:Uncharacterized protein n=1 Tax=Gonapodya prolifera (strain JEL478) TaxID=1344416 RepID=A0A139ASK3_GONPJ|nr:hypothetical protein M427DRAFT_53039 [Gonapodya prolifera JEL478]|eukprot:KXS19634.1 hypothetical protein M427DRAFT_53039 [Gonapodya prolifera JEL478]
MATIELSFDGGDDGTAQRFRDLAASLATAAMQHHQNTIKDTQSQLKNPSPSSPLANMDATWLDRAHDRFQQLQNKEHDAAHLGLTDPSYTPSPSPSPSPAPTPSAPPISATATPRATSPLTTFFLLLPLILGALLLIAVVTLRVLGYTRRDVVLAMHRFRMRYTGLYEKLSSGPSTTGGTATSGTGTSASASSLPPPRAFRPARAPPSSILPRMANLILGPLSPYHRPIRLPPDTHAGSLSSRLGAGGAGGVGGGSGTYADGGIDDDDDGGVTYDLSGGAYMGALEFSDDEDEPGEVVGLVGRAGAGQTGTGTGAAAV